MGLLDTIGQDAEGLLPGFLNPNRQAQGGLNLGSLFGALRDTGSALAAVSPVGIAKGAVDALNPNSDMDPLQRAMSLAPVALPLAGLGAYRLNRLAGDAGGYGALAADESGVMATANPPRLAFGLPDDQPHPQAQDMGPDRTAGLDQRTHAILGSTDSLGTVRALGRWGQDDQTQRRELAAGQVVDGIAAQGLEPRKVLAPIDYAYHASLINGTEQSALFNKLYGRFLTSPETLHPEQIQKLTSMVGDVYQSTKALDAELVVDPLLKVNTLQVLDAGQPAVASVDMPLWDPAAVHGDGDGVRRERARRLGQLNYRAMYLPGIANLRYLLQRGTTDLADQIQPGPAASNFDAFLGLDTGAKPPAAATALVEQAYRQLAQETGKPVGAVQAAVAGAWNQLRDQHFATEGTDPFRLNDYALSILEGSNPVGWRQILSAADQMKPASPAAGQRAGVGIEASRGSFAIHAGGVEVDRALDAVRVGHLAIPADENGSVWRLGRNGPLQLAHYGDGLRALLNGAPDADGLPSPAGVEVYHPVIGPDGKLFQHPATIPGRHGTFVADTPRVIDSVKANLRQLGIGDDAVRVLPGVGSFEPGLTRNRLGLEDMTPEDFASPDGPIQHNQWVGISAALSEERKQFLKGRGVNVGRWSDEAKHAELGGRLRDMGYKPIEQTGEYDGTEPSWLVHGMKPSVASKLADEYYQDSIVTHYGLLYGKHSENAGKYTPALAEVKYVPGEGRYVGVGGKTPTAKRPTAGDHIEFNQGAENYTSSLGEGDVHYQVQLHPGFNVEPVNFDPDAYLAAPLERTRDLVWVQIPDDTTQPRLKQILDAVGQAGATRPTLYQHAPVGDGFTRVVEHHYQTTGIEPGGFSQAAGQTLPSTPAGVTLVHRSLGAGDPHAPNRYVGWVPDADARWLGDRQPDMNLSSPEQRTAAPVALSDGSYLAHNDTRLVLPAGANAAINPSVFNTKVEGKYARHFAVETPDGQLPTITLGTDPIARADVVTGQVTGRELRLTVPVTPDGLDMDALAKALAVLRRNEVPIKKLKVLGVDGHVYKTTGEVAG